MSRLITGVLTHPDGSNITTGTIKFEAVISANNVPQGVSTTIPVTDGAYSATIVDGVYNITFDYSSVKTTLGYGVVVNAGTSIDILTLSGLSEIPISQIQVLLDQKQNLDGGLTSISGLTTSADLMIYTTALDTYATTSLTTFMRTLLDDADASTARQTLGVTIGTDVQAYNADIVIDASYVHTDNNYTTIEKTKLSEIQDGAQVNNISDINAVDLTDSGDSTLHYHSSDRNRSNHTGTQLSSTISDFSTSVDARISNASGVSIASLSGGYVPISQLPPSAIERLVVVADEISRFALTTTTVQNGDTVKQTDTGTMYYVIDDTNLSNVNGYVEYTAGIASQVNWSGVVSTPTTISGYGITDAGTMAYQNSDNVNITGGTITSGITITQADDLDLLMWMGA